MIELGKNAKLLGKYFQTSVWQLCDSCQVLDLIDFQNNLTWQNSNTAGICLDSRLEYSKITHRYSKRRSIHLVLVLMTFHWYIFHPFYLSISPVLWHKCQRVFAWANCTSTRHAGSFDCPKTSLILMTIHSGRGHWAWWQSCKVPSQTHTEIKKWKMYAIKQIKICAEYRDMLPRPWLDFSGTPGLRPIGLSQGSWQTSLGLGSMSRYSA